MQMGKTFDWIQRTDASTIAALYLKVSTSPTRLSQQTPFSFRMIHLLFFLPKSGLRLGVGLGVASSWSSFRFRLCLLS